MADANDVSFNFGDFMFAPPPQSQPQPQPLRINGVTSTSQNDAVWPDFFITPSPYQSSNGFFSQSPPNPSFSKPFDPFGFSNGNPARPTADPFRIGPDPGVNEIKKPKGALPLSLFGEIEEECCNNNDDKSKGWFDPNPPSQNGKFGVDIDILSKNLSGSGLNFDGLASDLNVENNDDEDDEWEFKGAFSGTSTLQGSLQEQGDSVVSGSDVESVVVMRQEKQDASCSFEHKLGSSTFLPQSGNALVASHGDGANRPSAMDVVFKSTTSATNGFMWDPFPEVEEIVNGSGISAPSINEDVDFGDFIDASKEAESKEQEQFPHITPAEAHVSNGKIQDKQSQQGNCRGPLPLSLFSDGTDESSDCLNHEDEIVHKPTSNPGNGFSGQDSMISIHDLLSNLYSQAQFNLSVDSNGKPAENGVHSPQTKIDSMPLSRDDDSWEFKAAISETGVEKQSSNASSGNMAQKQSETATNLQRYMDFYEKLRDSLCFLLSCQVDELKKARSVDTASSCGEKAESLGDEIQEAYTLMKESMASQEVLSKKHLQRNSCLNEACDILRGKKFKVIESEYSLSKRLQLALSEWRITVELLRHAISVLKILSQGSADEQSLYASSWSKIIDVCAQELKYGAVLWKRVSEKNMQLQILSDSRGQRYIQALGEIYRVVELIGLSAKFYKPWLFLSGPEPDSSRFFALLDECCALWSSSGLEQALQNLSENADFGCNEAVKTLIASIKNIRYFDVLTIHDRVFVQHKPTCRLSLLPQGMLTDLNTVLWNGEPYFLNLANLWANLISSSPPRLPHLQVS